MVCHSYYACVCFVDKILTFICYSTALASIMVIYHEFLVAHLIMIKLTTKLKYNGLCSIRNPCLFYFAIANL